MKTALTNLSNQIYEESRFRLNKSAVKFGVNEIYSYEFDDIKNTDFFNKNREILEQTTGIGFWLWKPYIILEVMNKLEENDIVIYSDCGIEIIASIEPLIHLTKLQPIVLFGNSNELNSQWTKRDSFVYMDCDSDFFWYSPHCDAAFALFRKCDLSIKFLNDWLTYGYNKYIITDLPNSCGEENIYGFIEHRRDQSILSLLSQKYKLDLFRMPSQFGNHYKMPKFRVENEFNCVNQINQQQINYYATIPYYNSPYYQLLDHHRSKEDKNETLEKKVKPTRKIINKLLAKIKKLFDRIIVKYKTQKKHLDVIYFNHL